MEVDNEIASLIRQAPKVELHLHIEGTLEPELLLTLAERHAIDLDYEDVEQVRDAYEFADLQSFLDIYYRGADVLRTPQDFEDLTWAYIQHCDDENIRHVEIFFDPQTHTGRGIDFNEVVDGISVGLGRAERELGITNRLIACFLRHLSPDQGEDTLSAILERNDAISGIGLDSAERGNPPEPFAALFDRGRAHGLHTVAHAGEEGPASYIEGALDSLRVERIDHGIRCFESAELVDRLATQRVPLTVCPLSNVALQVVPSLDAHPLARMLDAGLVATVNSDDPAYFGGYLTDNFLAVAEALGLTREQISVLLHNSIDASFAAPNTKDELNAELSCLEQ
jgi:adenosine deaminase